MPTYEFLLEQEIDTSETAAKIRAMQKLGVPYEKGFDKIANDSLRRQAESIAANLRSDSIRVSSKKEVIAIIAYLQRMGADINKTNQ